MLRSRPLILLASLGLVAFAATVPAAAQEAPRKPLQRGAGQSLPDTPEQRAKVLDNLYAHLATAADAQAAAPIVEAIERIWMQSGSDTVALLMDRAMKVATEKRLDLAMKLLDTVVGLAPDFPEGWHRRAYVYYMQNDYTRAIGDLRRVLALEPNHFKALDGLGQILREIGEKKAALAAYKKLLDVHPNASDANQAIEQLEREVEGQGI